MMQRYMRNTCVNSLWTVYQYRFSSLKRFSYNIFRIYKAVCATSVLNEVNIDMFRGILG